MEDLSSRPINPKLKELSITKDKILVRDTRCMKTREPGCRRLVMNECLMVEDEKLSHKRWGKIHKIMTILRICIETRPMSLIKPGMTWLIG